MNVIFLEPYALNAQARVKTLFNVVTDLARADVALIRSNTRIDQKFLAQAPALKLVVSATSGFDHMDWREAQARGVVCSYTPEANAVSAAELTIALITACERQLPAAMKNVRANAWREGLRRPRGLDGKMLGIVGLGRIGSRVARIAQALEMKIQAYDPYAPESAFASTGAHRIGFVELLRSSDIVSLHVPLTKETRHMLAAPTFLEMQNDAYLINTCRGPVVDENDLMSALDDAVIAGAAMDVIEREPPPSGHRVLTHPRLILTPHIGAYTESAWEKASQEAVEKVIAFAGGSQLADTLPISAPWFEKA